ncbi:MAG: ferrous iron transport protein B [Pirellulales bacterium]
MSTPQRDDAITVALLGNPNTGKSTLFSALAGVRQRVGNYPGVTVEKKIGQVEVDGVRFRLVDLPGTYSLAPRSPDEMIAVDVLLGRLDDLPSPDAVLCIVDASNLQRNLYLVSQVLELGLPTLVALNMTDVARERGIQIDIDRLQRQLGVPIVATQAHRRVGIDRLRTALIDIAGGPSPPPTSPFPEPFQQEVMALEAGFARSSSRKFPRYLVERLLLDTSGYLAESGLSGGDGEVDRLVVAARQRLADSGHPVPAVEAIARYGWVEEVLEGVVVEPTQRKVTVSDRVDRILTHKVWGSLVFVAVMIVVFQSIFTWAGPAMNSIEWSVRAIGDQAASFLPTGAVRSLVVDGVIAGVGAVLIFLPQIFILFFFIALLEGCGYMARAAYLMDKLMAGIGLSGKSFIPLLSSFACAIPGIMSARVIENRRDRLVTILVAPLMSCSARLPVYTLLIAAFIPDRRYLGGWLGLQGMTLLMLYALGIGTAICVALVLNKTLLRGETPPFVLELPGYKLPSPRNVLARMAERGWAFIRRAGTLILAVTVLVWAAGYFPHSPEVRQQVRDQYASQLADLKIRVDQLQAGQAEASQVAAAQAELATLQQEISNRTAGAYMEQSILGRLGRLIEPAVRPLGWDWRIGAAVLASFPAREVVIGTMGVIYNLGGDQDEESVSLQEQLRSATRNGTRVAAFDIPVAVSIMVFFALCAQCAATLVVIRRETASWRWPLFTFSYMTVLAYVGALLTYQLGTMLGG